MSEASLDLPPRSGPKPRTTAPAPHAQVSQIAPEPLQELLAARALDLPGVVGARSLISVPGARAFVLDGTEPAGPAEAFLVQREFAHLHPPHDGSLHLALPQAVAEEAYEQGWGEPHPLAGVPLIYGPRDEEELEVVWRILRCSYDFATDRL